MTIFVYDKTFEGFLTLVNDARDLNVQPDKICGLYAFQDDLWATRYDVVTDETKCNDMWNQLQEKLSPGGCQVVYRVFLSGIPEIEMLVLRFVNKVLNTPHNIEGDFGDSCVLEMHQLHKKVSREADRIRMFARFQESADDLLFAPIEPKYNVLPLVLDHFKNRYPEQRWVMYDTKRKYGFLHSEKELYEVKFENSKVNFLTGKVNRKALTTEEQDFQQLWLGYLDAVNIRERRNLRLQMQHMPKRFWKYLTEKNTALAS